MSGNKNTIKKVNRLILNNILLAASIIIVINVLSSFYNNTKKIVNNNILNNVNEIAEHDLKNINSYIESVWNNLTYIGGRIKEYDCKTISDLEQWLNTERVNSDFTNLYLLAEDGSVYSDAYLKISPEEFPVMDYFKKGDDKIIMAFLDNIKYTQLQKECILYGIKLENLKVDGTRFVALLGINDIESIRKRLLVNSFTKDDQSRGYSVIIDNNGTYLMHSERTLALNKRENFFDLLEEAHLPDNESKESIKQKFKTHSEKFMFQLEDTDGIEKVLYCIPIENMDMTMLMMVQEEVFREYTQNFIKITAFMIIVVTVVVMLLLSFIFVSRRNEIRTEALSKAQNEFLSNMSHEIRTPLNGIIGLIHLAKKNYKENNEEKIDEYLDKAHSTSLYLLALVNDVLDTSKITSGNLDLIIELCCIEKIFNDVCAMQSSNIQKGKLKLITECNIDTPYIMGDDIRIKQILMNVVGNAVKYTPEGGEIRLSVSQKRESEGRVATTFICSDTGIGMSEDFVKKIFDKFSQERSATTKSIKGTGLGMTISKMLLDIMGGEISVKSRLNEGSEFTVVLHSEIAEPAHTGEDLPIEQASADKNERDIANSKILIAEDNELNAEILMEILSAAGFEVVHAENGQKSVELFANSAEGDFGVILMDMQMPVLDGCEATKQIRMLEREDAKKVLIFACTANTFSEDRNRALESGMNDFIPKPIDVNLLFEKLGVKQ